MLSNIPLWMGISILLITSAVGFGVGYFVRKSSAERKISSAEDQAKLIVENANKEAESLKKERIVEAKDEAYKIRSEAENEIKERRNEIQRQENRLIQKEELLDRKLESLEQKEESLNQKQRHTEEIQSKVDALYKEQIAELERISNLTKEEAKKTILANVEEEVRHETAILVKDIEMRAREEAEKKAKEILSLAIQRCAADHVAETTVSVVSLPNDEMKGRIIGREGRNIRALETLTGIDLIIDDTPEAVILSGFDPIRREIAKTALEN